MRTHVVAKLFYESIVNKAIKHEFIECPVSPKKRKRSDYITLSKCIFRYMVEAIF